MLGATIPHAHKAHRCACLRAHTTHTVLQGSVHPDKCVQCRPFLCTSNSLRLLWLTAFKFMLDVVAADKYVKSSRTILHQSSDTNPRAKENL